MDFSQEVVWSERKDKMGDFEGRNKDAAHNLDHETGEEECSCTIL